MPVISYREALNEAMREEMQRDENIFILGEDVGFYGGAFKVTEGLFSEFGEKRVVDTPIAEGLIVGAAVGAAMVGLRPIAELMTVNFALLAMDQITKTIFLRGDLTQEQRERLLEIAERCPVNRTITTECHVVGRLG